MSTSDNRPTGVQYIQKSGVESGALEAQSQAQQAAAGNCTVSQETQKALENQGFMQSVANPCGTVRMHTVPPRGVEHTAFSSENQGVPDRRGPKSGPHDSGDALPATSDPAFALLVNAWPSLSLADKKAILAIVRRASGRLGQP